MRVHLIEFHEQLWFPATIREEITDALQFGLDLCKAYAPIATLLRNALTCNRNHSIVDLCSGGGGPWPRLSEKLQQAGQSLQILLTDKYPRLGAEADRKMGSPDSVSFYPAPVDPRDVPIALPGFRTMFSSFHHFSPEDARAVLQNAISAKQPIGVFEITSRTARTIGLMIPWALLSLFFTPWIRPFRWSRLLWTYLIPVIPLVLLFDGVVSCLRSYKPSELREMVEKLNAPEYQWEIGEQPGVFGLLSVTYAIGIPNPALDLAAQMNRFSSQSFQAKDADMRGMPVPPDR